MAVSESPQPIELLAAVKPLDQLAPPSPERHHVAWLPLLAVHALATSVPARPATNPGSLNDAPAGSALTVHPDRVCPDVVARAEAAPSATVSTPPAAAARRILPSRWRCTPLDFFAPMSVPADGARRHRARHRA